jgi:hypothetical protein
MTPRASWQMPQGRGDLGGCGAHDQTVGPHAGETSPAIQRGTNGGADTSSASDRAAVPHSSVSVYRVYETVGADGYPSEWHETVKHLVREQAGHRCVRCHHPYAKGDGEWSGCDALCDHGPPTHLFGAFPFVAFGARWRILTVHHLNGDKADCRWWNLAALCQRCHLRVQRVVVMDRVWPWPHSEWFRPYAAGWYAHAYLGEDLSRAEAVARVDELLALEQVA